MNNEVNNHKIAIVLAMHGSPPKDFPKKELAEFFDLHQRLEFMPQSLDDTSKQRCFELDEKMKSWPRTKYNDPFFSSSYELAAYINKTTGFEVCVGFNEFCNPTIRDALEDAVKINPHKIIVITTMMTPGGEHAEIDIPMIIADVQKQYPTIPIKYAWPFKFEDVTEFLHAQIKKYL